MILKRLSIVLIFIIVSIIISTENTEATLLNLTCGDVLEDSYVSETFPDTNYGSTQDIQLIAEGGDDRHLIFKFNISEIPSGVVVSAASLSLYLGSNFIDAGESMDATVHHVYNYPTYNISDKIWNESNITYNTRPDVAGEYNTTAEDTLQFTDGNATSTRYAWDVTKMVQKMFNLGENNMTIMVLGAVDGGVEAADELRFKDKSVCVGGAAPEKSPQILITYAYDSPQVTLSKPDNAASLYYKDRPVQFNFSVEDGNTISNATLYGNFSGTWLKNVTNNSQVANDGTVYNLPLINISRNYYIWNVRVCDSNGNCSFASSNRTLSILNTAPSFDDTIPGASNAHTANLNYNVNCTDLDSDTITYTDNTSLFIINDTTGLMFDNPGAAEYSDNLIRITCNDTFTTTTQDFWYNITNVAPAAPTLTYPTDLSTVSTSYTFLNYTTTDTEGDTIRYYVYADTNVNPGTLVYNGTDKYYNITGLVDGNTYYWKVHADDSVTNSSNSSIWEFYVSTTAPAINLDILPNEWITNNNTFQINVTATDTDGVDTCRLYGNWSGGWHLNDTDTTIVSGTKFGFTQFTLPDEAHYRYGIWCNDTAGSATWYVGGNISFGVDTITPTLSISSPESTTYNVQTMSLSISASDTLLDSCAYYLYYNDSGTLKESNTSFTCSGSTTLSVPYYAGGYVVNVTANDSASNINELSIDFLTEDAGGGGGGGGGGTTLIIDQPPIEPKTGDIDLCGNSICELDENPLDCPADCKLFSLDEMLCSPFPNCGNWERAWFINTLVIVVLGFIVYYSYKGKKTGRRA